MVTIDDFKKLEIISVQIKDVQDHPNADKLYLVRVDTGSEERKLVAGIRPFYTKEQLIGRQVIMIRNLEPAVIRGEESQGMILAVSDSEGISLLQPDRKVALGQIVKQFKKDKMSSILFNEVNNKGIAVIFVVLNQVV